MHVPLMLFRCLFVAGAAMFAAVSAAVGQCANAWRPGEGVPGADGDVLAAVTWDPDGSGPLGEHVVLGGKFRAIGSVMVEHVALWDPATGVCTPLGAGLGGNVTTLFVRPSGELVAGGAFPTSTGSQCARWTGTAWAPLGAAPTGAVTAFATLPNGDLAAACSYPLGVARWNGVTWASLGSSPLIGARSLSTLANGTLLAGGYFPQAFPGLDAGIMAWNGSSWAAFADIGSGSVRDLEQRPNGDIIAAGDFTSLGGVALGGLARWNGTAWSSLGSANGYFYCLANHPNGDLLVGGFHFGGGGLRQWNGTTWSTPPAGFVQQYVYAIAVLANGDPVIGGYLATIGTQAQARNVARGTASGWVSIVAGGVVYSITNLAPQPNGDLVAGGNFVFPGIGLRQLARRSAGAWSPLGYLGIGNGTLLVRADGTMIVGVGSSLVRWDGTAWTPFGLSGAIDTLFELPSGDIVAGGNFQVPGAGPATVARWDGSTWHSLGSFFGDAKALAMMPNGDLVAAGAFYAGGAYHELARWNGSQWSTWDLAPGLVYMASLLALSDGSLVVGTGGVQGGSSDGTVARWDGAAWTSLGGAFDAPVKRLLQLPDGDLIAGGRFSQVGGVVSRGFARWDGASWQAFGDALNDGVNAIALAANGDLVVGGSFTLAGGAPSSGLAVLTTTCPATAVAAGAGCAGASVTASLPWTGSLWGAHGSGLPNAALVFAVQGFATTSLPLASVFATALPGCTLRVQPDSVALTLANAGTAAIGFAVPNTPSLAGTTFHHQMVSLALDATLAVIATNAVTLTVGTF